MADRSLVQIARTLPWHGVGGMETHSWELSKALARRGWEIDVLTTSFDRRTWNEDREGIRVHYLHHLPANRDEVPQWRWWHRFPERVRHYAASHRIHAEAVHSESAYGHRLFRLLRRTGAPTACVMTLHGTTLLTYREATRAQLLKEAPRWHPRAVGQALYVRARARKERRKEFPSAHRIVAVSERVATHLAQDYEVPRDRIDVIANGVETPLPRDDRDRVRIDLGLPRDSRIILFVGRLDPSKRIDALIQHLPRRPRDRLLVAGTGVEEPRLRELAGHLPNPGAVRFLGAVVGVPKQRLYVAADVFALPSDLEGQPVTILEALSHGTPVYTRRPWVPDDVRPYVATGDDVTAGIDAAHALADRVGAAARSIASEHSWDRVAERYTQVLERARPDPGTKP